MQCIVKDLPVSYEEYGTGRPFLILHGWGVNHRSICEAMEPLFTQRPGWRRIYPDLPGMGNTPAADWITTQDDMLAVVLGLLDAVAPGERFAVMGESYGGYLARGIVYARGEMLDGVLLNVPGIQPDPAQRRLPSSQVLVPDPAFVAALEPDEQFVLRFAVLQRMELLTWFRASLKSSMQVANRALLQRLTARPAFSFDVDTLPAPCPAPTLILTGRQEAISGYKDAWALLDNFPRGTFAVLDHCGHLLGIDQPILYRALIAEWLNRVEEYAHGIS